MAFRRKMRFRRGRSRRRRGFDMIPFQLCQEVIEPPGFLDANCENPFLISFPLDPLFGNMMPPSLVADETTAAERLDVQRMETMSKGLLVAGIRFTYYFGATRPFRTVDHNNVTHELRSLLHVQKLGPGFTPLWQPNPFSSVKNVAAPDRILWRGMDLLTLEDTDPEGICPCGNFNSVPSFAGRAIPGQPNAGPVIVKAKVRLEENDALFWTTALTTPSQNGSFAFAFSLWGVAACLPIRR